MQCLSAWMWVFTGTIVEWTRCVEESMKLKPWMCAGTLHLVSSRLHAPLYRHVCACRCAFVLYGMSWSRIVSAVCAVKLRWLVCRVQWQPCRLSHYEHHGHIRWLMMFTVHFEHLSVESYPLVTSCASEPITQTVCLSVELLIDVCQHLSQQHEGRATPSTLDCCQGYDPSRHNRALCVGGRCRR